MMDTEEQDEQAPTFAELIDRMREQARSSRSDAEVAHSEADELLVEALRILATKAAMAHEADQLIEAYNDVKKWYA